MDEKRAKQLASIAYIIVANEFGFTNQPLDDDDLAKLLTDYEVTLEEMLVLDEIIQNIMEFLNDEDDNVNL